MQVYRVKDASRAAPARTRLVAHTPKEKKEEKKGAVFIGHGRRRQGKHDRARRGCAARPVHVRREPCRQCLAHDLLSSVQAPSAPASCTAGPHGLVDRANHVNRHVFRQSGGTQSGSKFTSSMCYGYAQSLQQACLGLALVSICSRSGRSGVSFWHRAPGSRSPYRRGTFASTLPALE